MSKTYDAGVILFTEPCGGEQKVSEYTKINGFLDREYGVERKARARSKMRLRYF